MTRALAAFFLASALLAQKPAADTQAKIVPLFEQARRAEKRREFEQAAQWYDRILAIDATIAEVWNNKGLVLYELGKHPEALSAFTKAAALKPELLTPHLFAGLAQLKLGQPARAVAPLEHVLAIEPGNSQAGAALAQAYLELERFDSATTLYRKLAQRDPKMMYQLGIAYLNWSKAAGRRLLDRPEPSPYGKILLGEMLALRGIHAEAEANLRAAAAEVPAEPPASDPVAPAVAAFHRGEHDRALEMLRELPGDGALYWFSRTCRALARASFLEAIRANPDSYQTHLLLADLARASGDPTQALAEYEKAIALAPANPQVHLVYIQYLTARQRDDPALERARSAVQKFPQHAALNCELGKLLLKLKRHEEARPFFERSLTAGFYSLLRPRRPRRRLCPGRRV